MKLGKYAIITGAFGNCFRNTLTINKHKHVIALKWYGGEFGDELIVNIHLKPFKLSWNSTVLARKFGECHEAPFGEFYQWDSKWFGLHQDL